MVTPSLGKKMVIYAITKHKVTIKFACSAFKVSETCLRFVIDTSLSCLLKMKSLQTGYLDSQQHISNEGFGLCFLYLHNSKGFTWNHKRVYRIYKQLELNLRD